LAAGSNQAEHLAAKPRAEADVYIDRLGPAFDARPASGCPLRSLHRRILLASIVTFHKTKVTAITDYLAMPRRYGLASTNATEW
jgi:hypothetical protein